MHELNDRQSRAVLAALFNPGLAVIGDLIDLHGPQTALEHVLSKALPIELDQLVTNALADHDIASTDDVHRLAASIERDTIAAGAALMVPGDEAWPTGLDDLTAYRPGGTRWSAPWCLWVQTSRAEPPQPGTAVGFWGHRVSSSFGADFATQAAMQLAEHGYGVVCNGETGVALAAGQGATRGKRAFAVVAGGLGRTYPRGNEVLLELVAQAGAVYTAQPPGRAATAWSTRYRDVLLAAIATCIAAVEVPASAVRSAVFATAADLDRPIFSTAHAYLAHKQIGNWRLEAEGAVQAPSARSLVELVNVTCPRT